MAGVINVSKPRHLLAKLEHEAARFRADPYDTYAAINALRDAYHIREWIWDNQLQNDPLLQQKLMQTAGGKQDWERYVNTVFPLFSIVRDICNGSKHFSLRVPGPLYEQSVLSGGARLSDNFKTSDASFYVRDTQGQAHSVHDLVETVRAFWENMFQMHPELE